MLKKTVTYEDYNGEERTEDFYFNLSKVECMELEFGYNGGETLSGSIRTLMNAGDVGKIIETIKSILLKSYGVKSPDGKRFVKNDDVCTAFEESPAFEQIYWELVTDVDKAADFIGGIAPKTVRESLGDDPKKELLARMKEFEESNKQ